MSFFNSSCKWSQQFHPPRRPSQITNIWGPQFQQSGQETSSSLDWPIYEGTLKDGKPHGQGIIILSNGNTMEGTWDDGKMHGQGALTIWDKNKINTNKITYKKGFQIEGAFQYGQLIEPSTKTNMIFIEFPLEEPGSTYLGEYNVQGTVAKSAFVNQADIDESEPEAIWNILKEKGVFDDRGKINTETAIDPVNVNSWLDGRSENVRSHVLGILQQAQQLKANGQGTMKWPNGDTYVGEFKDGKPHGQGTYTWPNGNTYVGNFKDGLMDGRGTLITWTHVDKIYGISYRKGNKQEGTFVNGKMVRVRTVPVIFRTWPDGRKYTGEYMGKNPPQPHGQGQMEYPTGHIYEGGFKKGNPNGHGTMNYGNWETYEGQWVDGEKNGKGTYTGPYGSILKGIWVKGEIQEDVMISQNGYTYEGKLENTLMHEQEKVTYPNGDIYVGVFKDGKRHGQGTYTWPNGNTYVGNFKDGLRDEKGKKTWPNGRTYKDEYKDDNPSQPPGSPPGTDDNCSHNELRWEDGSRYVGSSINWKPHGEGTMNYGNQNNFKGQWNNGKRHGIGVLTLPDGSTTEGTWVEGMIKRGEKKYRDGRTYIGEFKNELRHGKGIMTWPDGYKFDGKFRRGKPCGNGTITEIDGRQYQGISSRTYTDPS
jgi:hypothetical protein